MENKKIARWMFWLAGLAAVMVVLGGLVRLTQSGLSMTDWDVLMGIFPPVSEQAWQQEFEQYKQFPEYKLVNKGMSLQEFKFIFYMEYLHRMLGRVLGLVYFIPLVIFWKNGSIPREQRPAFLGIGVLLLFQGLFGWYMVKSGLVDRPHVSHFRLTGHLLLAMAFLAATLWMGMRWLHDPQRADAPRFSAKAVSATRIFLWLLIGQVALGGLVAGLKAGAVSPTFPLMHGQWIPPLIWSFEPWYMNFSENPVMIHFLHRWNAFIVLFFAFYLVRLLYREPDFEQIKMPVIVLSVLINLQLLLGIFTVLMSVPVALASLHQAVALLLFVFTVILRYSVRTEKHAPVAAKATA